MLEITKRNGSVVPYDLDRIKIAIENAARETGEMNKSQIMSAVNMVDSVIARMDNLINSKGTSIISSPAGLMKTKRTYITFMILMIVT